MTHTSNRQDICWTAAESGWTEAVPDAAHGVLTDRYVREAVTVTVMFTTSGRLYGGDRVATGQQPQMSGSRGKRQTVLGWLTEADTEVPADLGEDRDEPTTPEQRDRNIHASTDQVQVERDQALASAEGRGLVHAARQQITEVADANGWTVFGRLGYRDHAVYSRADVTVTVWFSAADVVTGGKRQVLGQSAEMVSPRGKRVTVLRWLTEVAESAPAETTGSVAITRKPTGTRIDHSDGTTVELVDGCRHGRPWSSGCSECARLRREDRELAPVGQANARIAELEGSVRVLEHAAIGLQDKARRRIAELEGQLAGRMMAAYDNLLRDWSADQDRIAQLTKLGGATQERVAHLEGLGTYADGARSREDMLREVLGLWDAEGEDWGALLQRVRDRIAECMNLEDERDEARHQAAELERERDQARIRVAELEGEYEHQELNREREEHERTRDALRSAEARSDELQQVLNDTLAEALDRGVRITVLEVGISDALATLDDPGDSLVADRVRSGLRAIL